MEHSEMRSETDLKSKLAKTLPIATVRPKSGLADKIFLSLKKEKSFYEVTCNVTPTWRCFWTVPSNFTNINAKMKEEFLCLE